MDVQEPVHYFIGFMGITDITGVYVYRTTSCHNYKSLYRVLIVFVIIIKLSRLVCTIPATFCRSSVHGRYSVYVVVVLCTCVGRSDEP